MILANARVLTLDPRRPRPAAAVGISGGKIAALGSLAEVRAALPAARVHDLAGARVLPGLIDAHGHLQMLGERMSQLDLAGARSPEEVADLAARRTAGVRPGQWIVGRGWDQRAFASGRFPDRSVLDAAAPDNPVLLERVDGHAVWVNRRALAAAGAELHDRAGGRVVRDGAGAPTGVLIDRAMEAVTGCLPAPGPDELEALQAAAATRCASLGLTGVHDAGVNLRSWAALERLEVQGRLPVRVYGMAWTDDPGCDQLIASGPRVSGAGRLTLRTVKLLLDGALGSGGAALFEPYVDDPASRGLLQAGADLEERLRDWSARGFQVALHAIGDRANAVALDALERALGPGGGRALRPRIEHAQLLRPADLARFAAAGVVASMQPAHAASDGPWLERALGPARLTGLRAYAWRSLLASGARLAFGSDFPIADPNPFRGLHAAIRRPDGSGSGPGADERLDPIDALRAYTEGAAWAAFEEDLAGRLRPGIRADLTVLDRDPLEAARDGALLEIRVLLTVVGGEVVYRRAGW